MHACRHSAPLERSQGRFELLSGGCNALWPSKHIWSAVSKLKGAPKAVQKALARLPNRRLPWLVSPFAQKVGPLNTASKSVQPHPLVAQQQTATHHKGTKESGVDSRPGYRVSHHLPTESFINGDAGNWARPFCVQCKDLPTTELYSLIWSQMLGPPVPELAIWLAVTLHCSQSTCLPRTFGWSCRGSILLTRSATGSRGERAKGLAMLAQRLMQANISL